MEKIFAQMKINDAAHPNAFDDLYYFVNRWSRIEEMMNDNLKIKDMDFFLSLSTPEKQKLDTVFDPFWH